MQKKQHILGIFLFLVLTSALLAEDITGFWQTIDKDTNEPSSVVAVYPYKGKYYARIIATYSHNGELNDTMYNPKGRAPGLEGQPFYSGLDFVWDAEGGGGTYKGYVVDPRNGKIYNAKLWLEDGNLVLRGQLFIFGRNEYWPPFPMKNFTKKFPKPDLAKFVPVIPRPLD